MTTEEQIKVVVYTLEYLQAQTPTVSLPTEFWELVKYIKQEESEQESVRIWKEELETLLGRSFPWVSSK